jgi:hypothetical protein
MMATDFQLLYLKSKSSQNFVMTDGQSASLSRCQAPIWGPTPDFVTVTHSCGFVDVGCFLWREDGCVFYCCWSSPAQSFSSPSPAGVMTIFYSFRFDSTQAWRARSPSLYLLGAGWQSYAPRHRVSFPSPPATRKATVEVFELASRRGSTNSESEFTTGGLSPVSSSWRQAPWESRPAIFSTEPLRS